VEFSMPLFVRAIVCRSAAPTVFHFDAQTDPPGTQARQMCWSGRTAERPALVTMDCVWQTVATKQTHELVTHTRFGTIRQDAHGQTIAAVKIAHRHRLTTPAIGSAKPTLEIHRPHFIGTAGRAKRRPSPHGSTQSSRARMTQPQTAQHPTDRTHGG